MWYHLKTTIGVFWISRNWDKQESYKLGINKETIFERYHSPEEAARDVYAHETDYAPWDKLAEDAPEELSGWERGRPRL
jgi:hypothetical protein